MGSGIAQSFLAAGHPVTLIEATSEAAERAGRAIVAGLEKRGVEVGTVALAVERLRWSASPPVDLEPALVVESVPEEMAIKQEVLATASRTFPGALIGTNTSGLSVTALSSSVCDPARFFGMHFFNPVPRSALIELVRGPQTSRATLDAAHAWTLALGKEATEVRDAPGFATSRLGIAIGMEAMRMVEESVASAEDIDRGMVLGYKFPIGPLELSDRVGLDVRLAIAVNLTEALGDRFAPPAILREKVAAGDLGVKSGRGFYSWADGHKSSLAP
jgi:3-hydroxybutyryl-CoA dehydrogenase